MYSSDIDEIGKAEFDEWREVMATNLDGAFLCTQAFGALMAQSDGGARWRNQCGPRDGP